MATQWLFRRLRMTSQSLGQCLTGCCLCHGLDFGTAFSGLNAAPNHSLPLLSQSLTPCSAPPPSVQLITPVYSPLCCCSSANARLSSTYLWTDYLRLSSLVFELKFCIPCLCSLFVCGCLTFSRFGIPIYVLCEACPCLTTLLSPRL